VRLSAGFAEKRRTGVRQYQREHVQREHVRIGNPSGKGSPPSMESFLVMSGSLICSMMGLIFMEVRRIRKKLEQRAAEPSAVKTAA